MKSLLVLRHAKSSWKHDGLPDHDRPLNGRGKRNAPMIGRFIRDNGMTPDLILSSTAVRAATTSRLVADECRFEGDLVLLEELYLARASEYLDTLNEVRGNFERVMVVGHNPGLEHLVSLITGCRESLPTAALACITLPIEEWRELEAGVRGELAGLWRPREVK